MLIEYRHPCVLQQAWPPGSTPTRFSPSSTSTRRISCSRCSTTDTSIQWIRGAEAPRRRGALAAIDRGLRLQPAGGRLNDCLYIFGNCLGRPPARPTTTSCAPSTTTSRTRISPRTAHPACARSGSEVSSCAAIRGDGRALSQAFACTRVVDPSYETRTSAPFSQSLSRSRFSVEPVQVVVRNRSGRPSWWCARRASSGGPIPPATDEGHHDIDRSTVRSGPRTGSRRALDGQHAAPQAHWSGAQYRGAGSAAQRWTRSAIRPAAQDRAQAPARVRPERPAQHPL